MAKTAVWHIRLGVRGKLLGLVLLLVVPLLVLEGVGIAGRFDRQVEQELQSNQMMANAVVRALNNHLENLWDAELAMGTAIALSRSNSPEPLGAYLSEVLVEHPTVRSFTWVDPTGRVVTSSAGGGTGEDLSHEAHIQRLLSGTGKDLSDLLTDPAGGTPSVAVSRAIVRNGRLVGMLVATVDLGRLETVLPSATRQFTLVDRHGVVVYCSKGASTNEVGRQLAPNHPVFRSLRGERVAGRAYMVENGETMTGVSIPVSQVGWAYYSTTRLADVLAPARDDAIGEVAGLLLVCALSLGAALLAGNRYVRPILALQQAARAISAGNLGARVNLTGFDELAAAARTFDTMAQQIQTADADQRARVSAVALLGQRALAGADTGALATEAALLVAQSLGADVAAVLEAVPGAERFACRGSAGQGSDGDGAAAAWLIPLAAYTLHRAEPVMIDDLAAAPADFAEAPALAGVGLCSCLAVAIGGPECSFGVLALAVRERRLFPQSDVYFVEAVANVLATAVDRKRQEAEQTLLAEASATLSSSLDYDTTLGNLAQLAVRHLCDWCIIEIQEPDGTVRPVAIAHRDPAKVEQGLALAQRYEYGADRQQVVEEMLRSRRPVLIPSLTDEFVKASARSAQHLELIRWLGITSHMAVPLVVRGRAIGAITLLSTESKRRFTPSDLALAEEVAHRAALAVDHARLYGEATAALQERDRALAAAEAERSRLQGLFEQAPALICLLYGPGHVVAMANHRYLLATGNRPMVGRPIIQALPELRGQGVEELLDQVFASGIPAEDSEMSIRLDRTGHGVLEEAVFDVLFQPVRDAAGAVEGILIYAVDVTEKVQARRKIEVMASELQELVQQQTAITTLEQHLIAGRPLDQVLEAAAATVTEVLGAEYAALAELLPDGATLLMKACRGWEPGAAVAPVESAGAPTLTSYTLSSPEPVVFTDLKHEARFTPWKLMSEAGVVSGASLVIPGEEGPYGILGVYASRPHSFSADDIRFLQTVALTIAAAVEQKRKEQRLAVQYAVALALADAQGSSDALSRILQVLCQGLGWDLGLLWTVDATGEQLRCTAVWQADGLRVDEFVAMSLTLLKRRGEGLAGEAWAAAVPFYIPDVTRKQGLPRWHAAAAAGLHTGFWFPISVGKQVLGIVECVSRAEWQPDTALLRTATSLGIQIGQFIQRRLAEEQLRTLNAELEQRVAARTAELAAANRELEAFAYSVSHDLREPLRAIDGFGRALWEDSGPQLGADGQDSLNRIRESARRMAGLIDDLLRLSRVGRSEIPRETVDLSSLARAVANDLVRSAPERNVTFDIEDQVTAKGDERLLRVVLQNLLSNAWKYTSRQEKAEITFGTATRAGRRVYFVKDNGVGFDTSQSNKLFVPFQRLHKASEFEGSGVGLATVQRVIHRHGGQVWAEGAVGCGATFFFTL